MKRFCTGFASGMLGFAVANVVAHFVDSSPSGQTDGLHCFGFPFEVWAKGGLPTFEHFSYASLWYDIAIALLLGVAVGLYWRKHAAG